MESRLPVVALVTDEHTLSLLRLAIGAEEIRHVSRAAALLEAVAEHGATAVVMQLADGSGTDTRPVIRLLHERLPEACVIVVHADGPPDPAELLQLGKLSVTAFLHRDDPRFVPALRAVLERAEEQSPAEAILRRVRPLVHPDVLPFFEHCARAASAPLTVEEAARAAGVSPRTLRGRILRAGLPSPQRIVRWHRVLHTFWRLDVSARPVKAVLPLLGYETESALRKQVARLTGKPISVILARGGFAELLRRFTEELASSGRT